MSSLLSSLFGTHGLILGTLVPFLFVLTVVVFVHEMGHYLVGRWCGIGVRAFSIGFGPELIGFNDRRGTRWKLSAIPLGGYVKFVGDMSATSTPSAEEMSALTDAERTVAFHAQPVWKRALTVFAGPLFNFLLTIAVFAVVFSLYGRVVVDPVVSQVQPDSAAAVAGFQPGDRFVSIDGESVASFGDVQRIVSGRAGDPLSFVMRRGNTDVKLVATPKLSPQTDALGNSVRIGTLGVVNTPESGNPRVVEFTPGQALMEAVKETASVVARTGQFLTRLAAGREDKCQLGGPVRIAGMAGKAAALGFGWLVQLVALLSVGIGILNLLPIFFFDCGNMLFYSAEAVKGRPVSERAMEAVYRAGFFLVLAFMGFVFWNDLFGC